MRDFQQKHQERLRAFGVHLALSLLVLFALSAVVIFMWYPPPFFAADGGWQGLQIITGVDLVLGPLLTLLVYNPAKGWRKLKMDLCIIALVQISALTAGAWIVADQRTRMVVFANNRFVSLSALQIEESGVSDEVRKSLGGQNPPMAFIELPRDKAARQRLVMRNLSGELLFKRGDLYRPLTPENRLRIVAEGFDLAQVAEAVPERAKVVAKFLRKHDKPASAFSALPLYCRYKELSLVLERASGRIVDTVNITHAELLASLSVKKP